MKCALPNLSSLSENFLRTSRKIKAINKAIMILLMSNEMSLGAISISHCDK